MAEIVKIQLYYRKWYKDPKDQAELELIEDPVESQDSDAIKFQVSALLRTIKSNIQPSGYFYVVFKARKNDGKYGYRTVIPKTYPNK